MIPFEKKNQGDLRSLCQDYYKKICDIESAKYDIEKEVEFKDYKVNVISTTFTTIVV